MDDSDTPAPAAEDADGGPGFADDPPAPLALLADAVDPLRATLQQATGAFGLPEPAMFVGDVLATPPDERFARSARRYAERFGDGALLSDPERLTALTADLPVADPVGRAVRVVVRIAGQLEGELLAAAPETPADAEPYLALAVAARQLRDLALDVGETFDAGGGADGDLAHLLSATLALTARLLELAPGDAPTADGTGEQLDDEGEQPGDQAEHAAEEVELTPEDWLDTVARDVVRAGYHRESAMGATPSTVPAAKSDAEIRRIVRLRGAAAAVDVLDLDPAGAAALVDESPATVEALLDRRG